MELVKVSEAAIRLGVSEKTIIRRLKRGDLKGHQETRPQGVLWVVEVPEEPHNQQASPDIDPDSDRDTRDSGEVIALRGLVEELRARVQSQEGQIETKDRQIEQLHVLLQQAQAALPAPRKSKGWWSRLWRR